MSDNDNLGVCGLCGRDPQKLELEIERLKDAIKRKQLQAYECTVCKKYFLAIGIMDGLAPKCYGCWQQTR